MVSNSPEKIPSYGLWYEGMLSDKESVRLLYHHVNATSGTALLAVEMWNVGKQSARVHISAGLGGPSYDELWVGHRAASEYLRNAANGAGWIVTIPPDTVMTAFSHVMPRGSVVSGIAEFRAQGAANVSLRVYLAPSGMATGLRPIDTYIPSPILGQWEYPDPLRQMKARYEVGGNWAFVTIGDRPAIGLKSGDLLQGCYGVIHDVKLELTNPTQDSASTSVMLEPAGGPARGCMLVDGRYVQTPVLRNNQDALVAKYQLAPGETRTVDVLTMPQAGSNYPVRLVVRPS